MKEITFINRNKKRWEKFEAQLQKASHLNPDDLADQFIQLTDDLAFARTYYPQSKTLFYLNSLSQKTHQEIYRNKRESGNRIASFIKVELPLVLYAARPYFIISLLFFLASCAIGVMSSLNDAQFVRLILGNEYVNLTLDNIEKGDPLGIYGDTEQFEMSSMIIINNTIVSWRIFLYGFLTPLGTLFGLFTNGMMVGAFQTFFYQQNLLSVSTYTIMIHGTLELSAVVLAGGAGLILGKHLLFPGTYPRKTSFIYGTKQGFKIMLPVTVVFFIAGLIESFVTRFYQSMDSWLNISIIVLSLVFIVWYFFILPAAVHSKFKK